MASEPDTAREGEGAATGTAVAKAPQRRSPNRDRVKKPGKLAERGWREVKAEYAGGEDFPLGGYLGAMAGYTAVVAAVAGVARATHRPIPRITPWDVVTFAGATHRLSRLVARDPVTSPLRAPFTRFEGTAGPAELKEQVRGSGLRKTVGELLTCPFCTGMWVATGLSAGMVFAPGVTRLAASGLTALTGADFLHFARAKLV